MKKITLILGLAGLLACINARAQSDLFSTVQDWTGTGTNEAVFEIDWNQGTSGDAMIWGYRWDGSATGEQMFDAIVAADPRLYAEISEPTEYGTAVFGLGFAASGDEPIQLSPALSFNSQHLAYTDYSGVVDSRTAATPGDLWQEGWYTAGYWAYFLSTDSALTAAGDNSTDWADAWQYSGVGMSSRVLEDGDVDGWDFSFYDGSGDSSPAIPVAVMPVPEPTTWALLSLGGIFFLCIRKRHSFKKTTIVASLAVLIAFACNKANAISLDDIQLWAGSGTNRAALVIEWNSPEVFNETTVPAPVANKTMVWGYRFNGTATGTQMMDAILAADPKLYVVVNETYGTFVTGIGYNLSGNGVIGVTDGTTTNYFAGGLLTNNDTTFADASYPINGGDLFWSGYYGPNWQVWNESNDEGGFCTSPNRGSSEYWNPDTAAQGQWDYAEYGLDELPLTNGSWIGFSVAAAGYDSDPSDPAYNAFNNDEQAPPSPDGTYVAYVPNTNDFATLVLSSSNLDSYNLYGDPAAVLGAPTLQFYDPYDGNVTDRVSIIDPPFNVTPDGSNVITEIESDGEITVQMAHKIYANPSHPYGNDLIVYGNSFFVASGYSGGYVSDATDLNSTMLGGIYGHPTTVSVSQDGTNWFAFTNNTQYLFPDDAYRWDYTNDSWTWEQMNPTKPLNPLLYTNDFSDESAAQGLAQYTGAAGGNGYSLQTLGLPWIQYVRIQPNPDDYTVIDAIAAVNPVVVGDALSIAPDNIASGNTNLFFQSADNCGQNQISIGFDYVSGFARISTVSLSDFDPFAPVEGNVSSAYKIQSLPVAGDGAANYSATVGLRAGDGYSGNGSDLRVFEWNCTNWISQPFSYNVSNNEVVVPGVTNFSAFVVSQIAPPSLSIQTLTNGFAFQFTPVANCPETLLRSTNLETWTQIFAFTATNAEPITLLDTNAPAGYAFYRLELTP